MNEHFINKQSKIQINVQKVFLKAGKNYPEFTFWYQSIHSFITHAFVLYIHVNNRRQQSGILWNILLLRQTNFTMALLYLNAFAFKIFILQVFFSFVPSLVTAEIFTCFPMPAFLIVTIPDDVTVA